MKVLICFIVLFVIFVLAWVLEENSKESDKVRDNCKKTDLYSIHDGGRAGPVYDCSGVEQ